MNSSKKILVLVEGTTELNFIESVLSPFFVNKNTYLTPTLLSKPGQKGGDVKFDRAKKDIGNYLKQRNDTWVTVMVDYYGIDKNWPGYIEAKKKNTPHDKYETINKATHEKVNELFSKYNSTNRFIPYISMHEFEALLFSDAKILERRFDVKSDEIKKIFRKYGIPEAINNKGETCPSRQIKNLINNFKKTTTGIEIAKEIGIERISEACPLFGEWVEKLTSMKGLRII